MKYSIIFLNYDPHNVLAEMTAKAIRSIEENSKDYDYEIIEVKNVVGYSSAVNSGFDRVTGDYIIVANSDILVHDSKWLEKYSEVPNTITSRQLISFYMNEDMFPDGCCWGLYTEDQKKIGHMDTAYDAGYGCDEVDYFYRAKELGIDWRACDTKIQHLENQTFNNYYSPIKEAMTERNVRLFKEKWGNKLTLKI